MPESSSSTNGSVEAQPSAPQSKTLPNMPSPFATFFRAATGNPPYDYQCRLACGEPTCPEPVERGRIAGSALLEGRAPAPPFPCESQLISIPTGLGKTAAY